MINSLDGNTKKQAVTSAKKNKFLFAGCQTGEKQLQWIISLDYTIAYKTKG